MPIDRLLRPSTKGSALTILALGVTALGLAVLPAGYEPAAANVDTPVASAAPRDAQGAPTATLLEPATLTAPPAEPQAGSPNDAEAPMREPTTVEVDKSEELANVFAERDYRLQDVREGRRMVPALAVQRMPSDLGKVAVVEERKRLFIKSLLPIVLQVNARITQDRDRLQAIKARYENGEGIRGDEADWLTELCERYLVDPGDLAELERRLDIVPPSLAIAQAVTESGWGTSYPARAGNALFGQYHVAAAGRRTTLGDAAPGSFQIRAFTSVAESVEAYIQNLNTHGAYKDFRLLRAKLREDNEPLSGYKLIGTLLRYSELGQRYIDKVRVIMRTENLHELDEARLEPL